MTQQKSKADTRHNPTEYNSLRNEMTARLGAIFNHTNAAITSILTALASVIALLVVSFAKDIEDMNLIIGFDIAQTLLLFIPLLFLFPLAIKSGENICQIVALSCYIRVFYEHNYYEKETELFAWEGANNAISSVNVRRRRLSLGNWANSEFFALSIISVIMQLAFSFLSFYHISILGAYPKTLLDFHVLLLVLSCVIASLILRATSIKRCMQRPAIKYTAGFVMYGQKQGLLPSNTSTEKTIDCILQKSTCVYSELEDYLRKHKKRKKRTVSTTNN